MHIDEVVNNTETQIENSTLEKTGNGTSSAAEVKNINETVFNQEEILNDTLVESLDPSQDRSDEADNQIIVDENEFEKEAIKEFEKEAITPPANSSLFSKLVKLFKRNSHVVSRAFLGV